MSTQPKLIADITGALETARRDLLDLGLRNPLINYRPLRARGVDIVGESPAQLLRVLVVEEKRMSFLPTAEADAAPGLAQPEEEAARQSDLRLQTPHTSTQLQSRLLKTQQAARTAMEEQGVNILYLALGMLRWTETDSAADAHRAPLILVPVELERSDARDRFHVRYSGEELGDNVSLAEKLKQEFGFKTFPTLPDVDELDVNAYFAQVQQLVEGRPNWGVETDAVALGFFSFAKLLMYRDLSPATWTESDKILKHQVMGSLLGQEGFAAEPGNYAEDQFLDDQLRNRPLPIVVDSDSSQTVAILDALDGRNMVIQGPPGTGKSQTIVNLISAAAGSGKTVLFVAEKMAALEVVKRRLDKAGLGALCLELHSNRSNKKAVLEELKRTMSGGTPAPERAVNVGERLARVQDRLNTYCRAVNEPVGETGERPCSVYGQMMEVDRTLNGVELPNVPWNIATGTSAETEARRELLQQLQLRLQRAGVPAQHPFWGSALFMLLPTDAGQIERGIREALQACTGLESALASLARTCGTAAPGNIAQARLLLSTASHLAAAPDLSGLAAEGCNWLAREADIARVIDAGTRYAELRRNYAQALRPDAWSRNVAAERNEVATLGSSMWRHVSPRWTALRGLLQTMCTGPAPTERDAMLAVLDVVIAAAQAAAVVNDAAPWMAQAFGFNWRGVDSDWQRLGHLTGWITAAHRKVAGGTQQRWSIEAPVTAIDRNTLAQQLAAVSYAMQSCEFAVESWVSAIRLNPTPECGPLDTQDWATLRERWERQLAGIDRLQALVAFNQTASECQRQGLAEVVELACHWSGAAQHLVHLFDRQRLTAVLQRAYQERPVLATFTGDDHEQAVAEFRQLDAGQLAFHRAGIAQAHRASLPSASGAGEVGVLWREFEKKRRHLPIRRLMQEAGHAIQSVKPVFMMSPLSIANYIPPACLEFDLVIFDEASQVKPVDALGAVVRGAQIVVVGDNKQLPPTSFFDSISGVEENGDEPDLAPTADIESILGMFSARGAHNRMLQWHYRSRHESLISVSNHLFYNDRLVVFPSPTSERKEIGLVYRHVKDAWYDRGHTRTNPDEAQAVANAVMEHARAQMTRPKDERLTLGVAAFSVPQADAITNCLEALRRADPACEEYFNYPPHEPFFVKNLENVQGDERDVIFISIGYARTRDGALAMDFGPVNRLGGERRLNVLISRARQRCEVFTSLGADDIDLARTSALGVKALKTFLQYAQTGSMGTAVRSGSDAGLDFEKQVQRELTALGFTVQPQVGCAGFYIDLAVADPENPGRYLLGVVCDGASYSSARSARDRDRLRQNVLEGLGWRIHRVWSTDWFKNPQAELKRLFRAIQRAQDDEREKPKPAPVVIAAPAPEPVEAPPADPSSTYECVNLSVRLGDHELHEVPCGILAEWLTRVVDAEGPIHWREACRRVMAAVGVQKMGTRIERTFEAALETGHARRTFVRRGDFLWSPAMSEAPIRNRAGLPGNLRKIELVAPEEIAAATVKAVTEARGIKREDLPSEICKLLGFGRVTEEMRAALEPHIQALIESGQLRQSGETITA